MKFDFWFDLPQALVNVMENTISTDEIEYSHILLTSYQTFKKTFESVNQILNTNYHSFSADELEVVLQRINNLKRETAELLCKAIKFSTKLMSRLLSTVESYHSYKLTEIDLLTKIKLFLKITRLVIDNAKSQAQITNGREQEFFTMLFILILGFLFLQKKFKVDYIV
jgi:hypothetical protein